MFLIIMQAVIHIPQPCSENWDAMQPGPQGRHCDVCAHVVTDFTQWTLQDIAKYLEAHKGQRTCGRFLTKQLNQPFDLAVFTPHIIRWETGSFQKIAALIIVCFALATTSCSNNQTPGAPAQEKLQQPIGILEEPETLPPPAKDTLAEIRNDGKARHKKVKTEAIANLPGYETTMGAPIMEHPMEIPRVRTDTPKFKPLIGPPEEDVKQE